LSLCGQRRSDSNCYNCLPSYTFGQKTTEEASLLYLCETHYSGLKRFLSSVYYGQVKKIIHFKNMDLLLCQETITSLRNTAYLEYVIPYPIARPYNLVGVQYFHSLRFHKNHEALGFYFVPHFLEIMRLPQIIIWLTHKSESRVLLFVYCSIIG
jgi:hypothetical protein